MKQLIFLLGILSTMNFVYAQDNVAPPYTYFPEVTHPCSQGEFGSVNLNMYNYYAGTISYLWSNGETTEMISGLTPGVYTVIITAQYFGTETNSFTINQPDLATVVDCTNPAIDKISLNSNTTGGTSPYSYYWTWSDGYLQQSLVSTDENVLIHHVSYVQSANLTVTDANGCVVTWSGDPSSMDCIQTFRRSAVFEDEGALTDEFKIYPIPTHDRLHIVSPNSILRSADIYNTSSQKVISVKRIDEGIDVSSLKAGIYLIKLVTDQGIETKQFIKE